MKFRFVDKMENWAHVQYYTGRKNGVKVEIFKIKGRYGFYAEREKDDFTFNSLWQNHPNVEQQNRLNNLPDMKFESDEKALEFVEKWIDENAPKLTVNK